VLIPSRWHRVRGQAREQGALLTILPRRSPRRARPRGTRSSPTTAQESRGPPPLSQQLQVYRPAPSRRLSLCWNPPQGPQTIGTLALRQPRCAPLHCPKYQDRAGAGAPSQQSQRGTLPLAWKWRCSARYAACRSAPRREPRLAGSLKRARSPSKMCPGRKDVALESVYQTSEAGPLVAKKSSKRRIEESRPTFLAALLVPGASLDPPNGGAHDFSPLTPPKRGGAGRGGARRSCGICPVVHRLRRVSTLRLEAYRGRTVTGGRRRRHARGVPALLDERQNAGRPCGTLRFAGTRIGSRHRLCTSEWWSGDVGHLAGKIALVVAYGITK